jgi:hypothetical protein
VVLELPDRTAQVCASDDVRLIHAGNTAAMQIAGTGHTVPPHPSVSIVVKMTTDRL